MSQSHAAAELATQPACWRLAGEVAHTSADLLPRTGERVAVLGCGTSLNIAAAYARHREQAGHGETDAFQASEFPSSRRYDRIVAISQSGRTSEIVTVLGQLAGRDTVVITAVADSPVTQAARAAIVLPFADEQSVLQTRSATSTLTLLRAGLGTDVSSLASQAEAALALPAVSADGVDQVTFVGAGAAAGIAAEAALKVREAAGFWSESYSAMDYRHGPITIAQPGRIVWIFGEPPAGLVTDVTRTGAKLVHHGLDAQAGLILAQRFALDLARLRGTDADRPRWLARSVVLT